MAIASKEKIDKPTAILIKGKSGTIKDVLIDGKRVRFVKSVSLKQDSRNEPPIVTLELINYDVHLVDSGYLMEKPKEYAETERNKQES